jgi:glucose-6-phosphate-specific signal transduction histidine kinase
MTDRTSAILAIVGAVILFLWAVPIVLFGRGPGAFELLLPGAIGLMLGLFLRSRPAAHLQRLGSILVVLGLVATIVVAALIWLLLNGLGRPF